MRPITAGTDKGATERAQSLGAAKASELRARIGPYFLRREKKHVFKTASSRCFNTFAACAGLAVSVKGVSQINRPDLLPFKCVNYSTCDSN